MIYGITTLVLFALMLVYFRIADRFNIIDKPNQRSSHTQITIRGGGIVFPVAALMSALLFPADGRTWILVGGILAISIVSFWDDVSSLPNKVRIAVHLIAVSAMLYATFALTILPWAGIFLAYILIIGTINAYNFMDGINGITGVYSLSVLGSALCYYYHAEIEAPPLVVMSIIACLVFLFFNFRKKAKCFAGDVGSVSIGFIVIAVLLAVILQTGELKYIFFLAVYGVDAVLTIIHRLMLRQNIFEAHRLHFYQILANERKVSHLLVAVLYGLLQLIVNAVVLFSTSNFMVTGLMVCLPLALLYIVLKPRLMKTTIK